MAYRERLRWLGFFGLERRRLRDSRHEECGTVIHNCQSTVTEKHSMK